MRNMCALLPQQYYIPVQRQRQSYCGLFKQRQGGSYEKILLQRVHRLRKMLITACPLCMYNLNKSAGDLPVYYFTELLAEALGVKEEVDA